MDMKMFEKVDGKKKYIKGSWKNAFKVKWRDIFLICFILYTAWSYNLAVDECREVMESPCDYCSVNNFRPYNSTVASEGGEVVDGYKRDAQKTFSSLGG